MGWISDIIINVSAFRIKTGEKLNFLYSKIGVLNTLTTTNKNSLVESVNEVKAGAVPYSGADKPININTQSFTTSGQFEKTQSVFERKILDDRTQTTYNYRKLTDVASLSLPSPLSVGDIIITLPIKGTTQWTAEIDIQQANTQTTKLFISAYSVNSSSRKVNVAHGFGKIIEVKFGRNSNNDTVLILKRDTGTSTFSYGRVNISTFYHSVSLSAELGVKSNYKIDFIDEISLTDFTLTGTILQANFERDSYLDYRRFGLGVTTSVNKNPDDFNLLESGLYGISTGAVGNPIAGSSGTMLHMRSAASGNTYWSQLYVMSNAGTTPRAFISHGSTSRTSLWAELALKSTIPSGQLTVNTTSDLVGGYVYLPSGNVTATLGLATHVLNAIVDGQTAYSWGNFRDYGLGRDTVAQGEVQIIDPTTTYVRSGFYAINPESNYPFSYGASIFGRKNNFEWLELVTNVVTGEFFLRNNITGLLKIWTDANFNPDSKVNNMENAVGIGFNNGSFSGFPYFFHSTGGYKFLATIEYINAQNYASVTYVNQQIANIESPYKSENNNIKTVGNGWQTYVGGRYNQALGDKITIKGNNLNYIGFNLVGSGALHAVLGNYNVNNGVLNNIVGNYNSANSNLINLFGNYLYSKQEGQSVFGNYNKIETPEVLPSKKKIHVFASGKSEYERDNAVEIFADNSTKARGRMYYDEQTRDEQWFEEGTTLIDVNYLNSRINGILQTDANTFNICSNNVLVVGVRKNAQTATDSEFQSINNENCFGVYGIAKGQYNVDADASLMYYKDSFNIGASATAALASVVDKKPYLVVVLDSKSLQFDSLQYLDTADISNNKQNGFTQVIIGSFVNHNEDIYFDFNQQIIM